jgi:hypothetical protein
MMVCCGLWHVILLPLGKDKRETNSFALYHKRILHELVDNGCVCTGVFGHRF